jgi:hypothetical protein
VIVSRRRLQREIVALGEAYRGRIAAAEKRARDADQQFNNLVKSVSTNTSFDGTVSILIRLEPVFPRDGDRVAVAERLARRITQVLYRTHEDWRRDGLTGRVVDLRESAQDNAR